MYEDVSKADSSPQSIGEARVDDPFVFESGDTRLPSFGNVSAFLFTELRRDIEYRFGQLLELPLDRVSPILLVGRDLFFTR